MKTHTPISVDDSMCHENCDSGTPGAILHFNPFGDGQGICKHRVQKKKKKTLQKKVEYHEGNAFSPTNPGENKRRCSSALIEREAIRRDESWLSAFLV